METQPHLRDFLDAIQDDSYDLPELWSITRDPNTSETDARRAARNALLDLYDRGYLKLSRELRPGEWRDLSSAEVRAIRDDLAEWGIETNGRTTLQVMATADGRAALERDDVK